MIESEYTRAIHNKLPSTVKAWKINDNFEGGVPDALYHTTLVAPAGIIYSPLWVEYKLIKQRPKRPSTLIVPELTEQQKLWLSSVMGTGAGVRVIVGFASEKIKRQVAGIILTLEEAVNGVRNDDVTPRLQSYDDIASEIEKIVVRRYMSCS